jgi:hypothetical protein
LTTSKTASYTRPDRKVHVSGRWYHQGGALWLGEVSVTTPTSMLHFSSATPMDARGLAQYATDAYLARFAGRFQPRTETYPA